MGITTHTFLNEARIRRALHSRVIRHHHKNQNTLVIDEMGVYHGQSRIDVAIINGRLSGFEIKSESDDLTRLPSQMDYYNNVFDELTLVVAKKFLAHSTKIIPDWWGVIVAHKGPRGGVLFDRVRSNSKNSNVDPYALSMLLWRSEVVELLLSAGHKGKDLKRPRRQLYSALVETFNRSDLQSAICRVLKSRANWRGR